MALAVLDSNVYVSALLFGGNPRAILELAEKGLFEIAVSEPIKSRGSASCLISSHGPKIASIISDSLGSGDGVHTSVNAARTGACATHFANTCKIRCSLIN